jgi:NADH-quinone oxidoreductase subunit N
MLTITFLSLLGLIVLFLGFSGKPGLNLSLTVVGLLAGLAILFGLDQNLLVPDGMDTQLSFDNISMRFSGLMIFFTFGIVMLGKSYLHREDIQSAEFLAVLLFSLVGALMLSAFTHMLTLFVGLETLGISLYILAGTDKKSPGSNESALKYLLMGAFATCLVLFGMAMLYGATGLLDFAGIAALNSSQVDSDLFRIGIFFLLAGVLFKVAAAPFHFWSPDVYEGAPNVVMLYMSVVVKIASFAALYRIFVLYFQGLSHFWWEVMYYAALASLLAGNLLALVQKSLKRQLAFSSISHTGYLLFAVLVMAKSNQETGILFYLFGYGAALIAAFSVLMSWFPTGDNIWLSDLKGAAKSDPAGAIVLTIAFLSMAGIPMTAGFFGKLYMFVPAMQDGLYHLLLVGITSSLIGAAYYLRPVMNVWFSNSDSLAPEAGFSAWIGYFCAILLLMGGLFPDLLTGLLAAIPS